MASGFRAKRPRKLIGSEPDNYERYENPGQIILAGVFLYCMRAKIVEGATY